MPKFRKKPIVIEAEPISDKEWSAIYGVHEELLGGRDGYRDPDAETKYKADMKEILKNVIPMQIL